MAVLVSLSEAALFRGACDARVLAEAEAEAVAVEGKGAAVEAGAPGWCAACPRQSR